MSGPLFNKIALIGIGLIGGSIAIEARKRGLANKIVAATRKAETEIGRASCRERV